jgi:hypothetical protein
MDSRFWGSGKTERALRSIPRHSDSAVTDWASVESACSKISATASVAVSASFSGLGKHKDRSGRSEIEPSAEFKQALISEKYY